VFNGIWTVGKFTAEVAESAEDREPKPAGLGEVRSHGNQFGEIGVGLDLGRCLFCARRPQIRKRPEASSGPTNSGFGGLAYQIIGYAFSEEQRGDLAR